MLCGVNPREPELVAVSTFSRARFIVCRDNPTRVRPGRGRTEEGGGGEERERGEEERAVQVSVQGGHSE